MSHLLKNNLVINKMWYRAIGYTRVDSIVVYASACMEFRVYIMRMFYFLRVYRMNIFFVL